MIAIVQCNVKKLMVAEADKENVLDYDCPKFGKSYIEKLPR